MNYRFLHPRGVVLALLGAISILIACQPKLQEQPLNLAEIENLIHSGQINKARAICDSIKSSQKLSPKQLRQLDSLLEIGRRIRLILLILCCAVTW